MSDIIEQKKRYIYACKVYRKPKILRFIIGKYWEFVLSRLSEGQVMDIYNKLTER